MCVPRRSDPHPGRSMTETDKLRGKITPVRDGQYLIGLSGGADSVALLTALLPDIRAGRIRAEAVHVNHGLRGQESDEDAQFCACLCEREGVPLYSCRIDLEGKTDEASARAARYAVFSRRYRETGADGLILAHHADDQAETFLMRLLRGAGPEGLECMKPEETVGGMRILRPMLSLRREEIRETLRADGISWREDSSNNSDGYLRNRIRKELIPGLERITPTAVEKICRTAGLIGSDNETLNAQAAAAMARNAKGRMLNAEGTAREPAAVRTRALRMWWQENGPVLEEHALSAAQTEALEQLLFTGRGKINLPGGMHAVRTGKYLFLTDERQTETEAREVTGAETPFGDFLLTAGASEGTPGDGKRTQEVPREFLRGCVIRTRRPGDRIRPFGSSGSKKLQDYFTDRRIPEPFRDRIPLLCRGNEVLLAAGVGAGGIPAWDEEADSVRLTWQGEMPWME